MFHAALRPTGNTHTALMSPSSLLISPVHLQVSPTSCILVRFPIPLHRDRQLDLYVPEPQVEAAAPETDTDASSECPIEPANVILLLLSFLWNLAVLVLGDLQSLLHDLYNIYQADLNDQEYVPQRLTRSSSFVISTDDLLGDSDFVAEEPIEMAGEKKVNKNHVEQVPSSTCVPETDQPNNQFSLLTNVLLAIQYVQTTTCQVMSEGFVDATAEWLYGLVFAYSVIFKPKIRLQLDLDDICQWLVESLFTYSSLIDNWIEAEDAPLPPDKEIDKKENMSLSPVNYHPKNFSEALKLYSTHGFYNHCRHHCQL